MIKRFTVATLAILLIVLTSTQVILAAASARDLDALKGAKLIYIATVRKNGTQSSAAPVWFVMNPDNTILISTGPQSWKAKRIRRGSPAMVWIDKADGPAFAAHAEIVTDAKSEGAIIEEIPKKYTMARVGLFKPSQSKFDDGSRCVIKFDIVEDLPDDFRSAPGAPPPDAITKLMKK